MNATPGGWVEANLAYDGVMSQNVLQHLRMQDVFRQRQRVELQKVVVLATAMMNTGNKDGVIAAVRTLTKLMFPEDKALAAASEERMRETLKTEGVKSYRVKRLKLGER